MLSDGTCQVPFAGSSGHSCYRQLDLFVLIYELFGRGWAIAIISWVARRVVVWQLRHYTPNGIKRLFRLLEHRKIITGWGKNKQPGTDRVRPKILGRPITCGQDPKKAFVFSGHSRASGNLGQTRGILNSRVCDEK